MADLKKPSGLPISLNNQGKLSFDYPKLASKPAVRKASDMKEVIYKFTPAMADRELYYMYRDIAFENDREKIIDAGLRYDITVMDYRPLGLELIKTKGHYHPEIGGLELSYPEVYEVLFGKAYYLIQRPSKSDFSVIKENYLIKAKAGEHVVIPPNFGHVTINPGPDPLVMSNWVDRSFESGYDEYQKYQGGSYYLLKSETEEYQIDKNSNYEKVPKLKVISPKQLPKLGLLNSNPMYGIAKSDISRLDFLSNPDKHNLEISKIFKND